MVDCTWSQYGDWTPCSKPCGVGIQTRSRDILVEARGEGAIECHGRKVETRICNRHPCGAGETNERKMIFFFGGEDILEVVAEGTTAAHDAAALAVAAAAVVELVDAHEHRTHEHFIRTSANRGRSVVLPPIVLLYVHIGSIP